MKIAIAQTKSIKGKIEKNIQNHFRLIRLAIESNVDLIVFPELSITAYEPELAEELAKNIEDAIFNPFEELASENQLVIGIGMPTRTINGIHISMLFFQPNHERIVYSKQHLHDDELPYFVNGTHQTFLTIKGEKIAFGICYEALQRQHFLNAKANHADIYIASVAKPKRGIEKAYAYFPSIAAEFQTPILMSNCIGFCDNFLSVGQSAIWNKNGELMEYLDDINQGVLIYDTTQNFVQKQFLNNMIIEKAALTDLETIFAIYKTAKQDLETQNIYQWTDKYPTLSIIKNDIEKEFLYVLKVNDEIVGAINISEEQETVYQTVDWKFDDSKVLVIHRLVVSPKHQRQGYATKMMTFVENYAQKNAYTSIRLDAYSQNKKVLRFYHNRNYVTRGTVRFPARKFLFFCMERETK
ncbi:MAG: GNAT family N-acetyltransferase [Saprospiraceae bacterium]